MKIPYNEALELNGGDLTQSQVDGLMDQERAVRIENENRRALGLPLVAVDVATAIGHMPPRALEPDVAPAPSMTQAAPAPVTRWKAPTTTWWFDSLYDDWARFEAKVAAHVGTTWVERVDGTATGRTFTEDDARVVCFAIRYQAGTYEQYARLLGIAPKAAQRRIKILERGGYLTTHVANPYAFKIASPALRAMKLVGFKRHYYKGAEAQIIHRLMVTELGLRYEFAGARVLSEYAIGKDPKGRLLFPSTTRSAQTHRPDLVVQQVDQATGEIVTYSVEYERTRKTKRALLNAIWATAQSGRVDAVLYLSDDRTILELVNRLAAFNKISDETGAEHLPLPPWL